MKPGSNPPWHYFRTKLKPRPTILYARCANTTVIWHHGCACQRCEYRYNEDSNRQDRPGVKTQGKKDMKKYSPTLLALGTLFTTAVLLAGCARSNPADVPLSPGAPFELPAPLYFLQDGQIWRLERDGHSLRQITHAEKGVTDFDVSPSGGALVYISANTLRYCPAAGEPCQVLLEGPELPAPENELAERNDHHHVHNKIATPRWSPDGKQIAYIQDGLRILTVAGRTVQVVHANDALPEGSPAGKYRVIAALDSWSPDGQRLLVSTYDYPLDSLYHQKLALKTLSGALVDLTDSGAGCTANWHPDGQTLYLAHPLLGGSVSLQRCSVADGRCSLLGQEVPARGAAFYAYPYITPAGQVYTWMGSGPDVVSAPETFTLFRINADGYGVTALRNDAYTVQTALWALNGQGVLVMDGKQLWWVPAGSGTATRLAATEIQSLRWGQ